MIIKVFIISYIIFFQPIKTPLESICPKDILCNHGSQTAKSDKERIATTFATDLLKKEIVCHTRIFTCKVTDYIIIIRNCAVRRHVALF